MFHLVAEQDPKILDFGQMGSFVFMLLLSDITTDSQICGPMAILMFLDDSFWLQRFCGAASTCAVGIVPTQRDEARWRSKKRREQK